MQTRAQIAGQAQVAKPARGKHSLRLPMTILGLAIGLTIALRPPIAGLSVPAMQALGLLAGAICFWIGRVFDDYVVALIMAIGWVALDIVPFETAFATFRSTSWWLMLGAMGLGLGVARSGLLRRATLLMLNKMPPTYIGQSLALVVTGLLTAPAIPSIIAKLTIASKFVPELARGMGLKPGSKASAGLFLSMYIGFVLSAPMFQTGSTTNLLMWEMLPPAERAAMTWAAWFRAAVVPGLLMMFGSYLVVYLFTAPKGKVSADPGIVRQQLQDLGPLTRAEKITFLVLLLAIGLWVTEAWHGISAVTVSLGGLVLMLTTKVVDKKSLQADLGWSTLIFLGVILNLGIVFPALGIDAWLGGQVSRLLAPFSGNTLLFIMALLVITFCLRFLIVSVNALMTILLLVLAPVLQEAGVTAWVLGFAVQCIGHIEFVLPYQCANYVVAAEASGGEAITPGGATRGSLMLILATSAAILASLPVWRLLGLVN